MKYGSIKLVLIIIFTTIFIFAQDTTKIENNAGKFILSVVGFESNGGKAMIALCNSEESYSKNGVNFKSIALEIEDQKTEWIIDELPFGEYAIKLYHDENGNKNYFRGIGTNVAFNARALSDCF